MESPPTVASAKAVVARPKEDEPFTSAKSRPISTCTTNAAMSRYEAFLEHENVGNYTTDSSKCVPRDNACSRLFRKHGLLFADPILEQEYELEFMRSDRNYTFLGAAGAIMSLYTVYLMTAPMMNRLENLHKYAAIFNDPDNQEKLFTVHLILHNVIQLCLFLMLFLLAVLTANRHRLALLRGIPALSFVWLISLTLLFVEVELSNLWDWQSGLANITIGNINISTFTPYVTMRSCGQNLTNGLHVREDGCSYTFASLTQFALLYGFVSGSTNSEIFIANLWVRALAPFAPFAPVRV